ncbi:hypothetical protein BB561_006140 [Smittium simulii]|uniref:Uncharacterized protein n=1 Tax=Smittium simulii TaxID=133385 RepID=A0A2T9Y699_9FUNG|nr:hypothetical protein BB561_006140 [Smittium simulii]
MVQNTNKHEALKQSKLNLRAKRRKLYIATSSIAVSLFFFFLYISGFKVAIIYASILVIATVFLLRLYRDNYHLERVDWKNQVVVVTGDKTVIYIYCDISNKQLAQNAVDQIVEKLGKPTVLFNNAAIVLAKSFLDSSVEELEKVINVSFVSSIYMTRAILPHMVEIQSGHIISVASILAFAGVPQCLSYCASKAALNIFFDGLRLELNSNPKTSNIHFSTIYPAKVTTNMFSGVDMPQVILPDVTPDDVAKEVIRSIRANKGRDIFMPITSRLAIIVAFFPRAIRDWCYSVAGIHGSLERFNGNRW